ncbi:MAG: tetratricopeptide repeat protein, partial [Deltaproteobacteria bacterium]|nr:tetratricopeptide repeat protein [Deltaproteobacteria bacterium]
MTLCGSCTKGTPPPTTSPDQPATAADLPPLGDTSAAYAGHAGAAADDGGRVRPAAAKVEDRDAAFEAIAHGNPEGAAAFLREHLQAKPTDRDARLALARAQLMLGAFGEAATTLADPSGSPDDPEFVRRRAQIAWRRGQADDAERLLDAGLRAHPGNVPLVGARLWAMARRGQAGTDQAKALRDSLYDAYDAGQVTTAEDLVAVAQAALSRGTGGAFHDANMVLQDAENLAPATEGRWISDEVLLLRGAMFLEKYSVAEAAETYGIVLQRDSWHVDALIGMARVHMNGLRFAEAARHAEEVLQVAPHHPDAHAVLARMALIEGRRDETERRGEQESLAANPHHTPGLAALAGLAIARDDAKAYARWRDAALVVDPRGRDFYTDLADILGFLHLYPESDQILREAVKRAPEDPYVQSALGLNLLRLGHEQEGRKALASAWDRDQFNERTHNVLQLYKETIDPHYLDRTIGDLTVRLPKEDAELIEPGLLGSVLQSRDELDGH